MSAVTAIHEQHAAAKQQLRVARDETAKRLAAHEHASKMKASRLAEIEAAYIANATSVALGLEPTEELPDANVLEKLRADVTVAEPVRIQLMAELQRCDDKLKAAENEHKSAVGDYLRETALAPAMEQMQRAFDGLRDAAVNLMAAHWLTYRKFSTRPPSVFSAEGFYGPASEWIAALRHNPTMWPTFPYDIRPDWLPRHGRFMPYELPGVEERVEQLLSEVEQVPA